MIDKIVSQPGSNWTKGDGSHNNIVISSRIRLARNIEKLPMPYLKNESSSFTVLEKTRLAYEELNLKEQGYEFYNMRDIPSLARQIMTEKHLISPEFAVAGINQGLIISADESVSIMINEEDHLRIQVLYSGLQLEEAWAKADKTDDLLESKLNYAFDEKKGYLTACPTNVGTGVRASVMVHLPALVLTKQAKRLFSTLNQLGLTVRGLYGEGTEAMGNFYQVSNRTTLGQKESEIIQNLTSVVLQITEEEEEIRQSLSKNTEIQLKDKVGRAIGTLKNAYILSSREALDLLSDVRLGQDLGIIDTGLTNQELTELIIELQPAFLQQYRGQSMEPLERDVTRAKLFKETLTKGGIK